MGCPLELGFLDFGRFEIDEGSRLVPIVGYLIRSGDRVVVVDTGFPTRYVEHPIASAASEGLDAFGRVVALTPDNVPAAQLALAGIEPVT